MIPFMKFKRLYFILSLIVIIPGLISLFMNGLNLGIDFTGGAELILGLQETATAPAVPTPIAPDPAAPTQPPAPIATQSAAQATQSAEITYSFDTVKTSLQNIPEALSVMDGTSQSGPLLTIRMQPISPERKTEIMTSIKQVQPAAKELRFETVGPTLGKELIVKTIVAILLSAGSITLYVAYRFKELKYGICAVLAMLHDSLVLLGSFSLLGKFLGVEIDTLFVTAILTILSFSVHDTIVVYDRIRELKHKKVARTYAETVDIAVNETLSRSIKNSLTIIFMLLALLILGGDTIRWFVFALLIGTITGTYSSTFTAAPLLVQWDDWAEMIAVLKARRGKNGKRR
jgi:preprotein translocase subunit SecF